MWKGPKLRRKITKKKRRDVLIDEGDGLEAVGGIVEDRSAGASGDATTNFHVRHLDVINERRGPDVVDLVDAVEVLV